MAQYWRRMARHQVMYPINDCSWMFLHICSMFGPVVLGRFVVDCMFYNGTVHINRCSLMDGTQVQNNEKVDHDPNSDTYINHLRR